MELMNPASLSILTDGPVLNGVSSSAMSKLKLGGVWPSKA